MRKLNISKSLDKKRSVEVRFRRFLKGAKRVSRFAWLDGVPFRLSHLVGQDLDADDLSTLLKEVLEVIVGHTVVDL